VKCAPIYNQINPPEDHGVRYLHVIECGGMYSIGIFVFAPNAKIPLHNHPDMSVLSRVLYGSIRSKSYDIIETPSPKEVNQSHEEPHGFKDRLFQFPMRLFDKIHRNGSSSENCIYCIENEEEVIRAPETTALYPKKGNLHEFTAGEEGACVLDVLVPPYESENGRDCTYFEKCDYSDSIKESDISHCIVQTIAQPVWFRCTGGSYEGLISYEDK
jgi:plant cysteine oxidase